MKMFIFILFASALFGCNTEGSGNDANPEASYRTVTIEGHEYIFISRRPWGSNMAMAHKANCKNH